MLLYFFYIIQAENKIPKSLGWKCHFVWKCNKICNEMLETSRILKKLIIGNCIFNGNLFSQKMDVNSLQKDASASLIDLFYVGAITYKPKDEKCFARSEYINQIKYSHKLILWRKWKIKIYYRKIKIKKILKSLFLKIIKIIDQR